MACKNLKKRIFCVSLAVLTTFVIVFLQIQKPIFVFATKDIAESKSKQSELQNQNSQLNKQLAELKENESKQEEYKKTLESQISVVEQQIDEANKQIAELDDKIQSLEASIASRQQSIDKNFERLKQRLKAIYMAGDTSILDIIFGAKNFYDFLDKKEIVKTVSEHDSELIEKLKKDVEAIKLEKDDIEASKKSVSENKSTLDKKQAELTALLEESQKIIAQIGGQRQNILDQIDENDSELQGINASIEAYYEEQRRIAEQKAAEQKAAQQQNSDSQSESSGSGSSENVQSSEPSGKRYIWPTPGFTWISSYYGETEGRYWPHSGIDIAGSGIYGSRVIAAASGRIIEMSVGSWGGGYGTYIVIDHGNGRATLYAHLSGVAVSMGSTVQQGQTIGYVGNTGHSFGPHLHFETRLYGQKYNPLNEF